MVASSIDLSWKILPCLEYQGLLSYSVSSSEVKSYATEYSNYITSLRGYEIGEVAANSKEEGMTNSLLADCWLRRMPRRIHGRSGIVWCLTSCLKSVIA